MQCNLKASEQVGSRKEGPFFFYALKDLKGGFLQSRREKEEVEHRSAFPIRPQGDSKEELQRIEIKIYCISSAHCTAFNPTSSPRRKGLGIKLKKERGEGGEGGSSASSYLFLRKGVQGKEG